MSPLEEVAAVLAASPGCTSGELRDFLRAQGRVSITTADVASVLRSHPARFRCDCSEPSRWWPAPAPSPGPGSAPSATVTGPNLPPLHAWQAEALAAWRRRGGRGVVEAVTGTGKTMVGIAAAADELAGGGQVCVLVPTTELLRQWHQALGRHLPAGTEVGLLGGGHQGGLGRHDVLVAVVNSARHADLRPRRPGGLLVADECHRYGSDGNRVALEARFARRLGLSATYARADDQHLVWLDPYFGGTCFRMGYRRAIADGVAARFRVALVAVDLDPFERAEHDQLSAVIASCRGRLVDRCGLPAEPFGEFMRAVCALAGSDGDGEGAASARLYLRASQDRRRLLAETPAKDAGLRRLVPALGAAHRAIVFTQTIEGARRAASHLRAAGLRAEAVHSGLDAVARRSVLARFGEGNLDVVAAPQVLDEGVDVPAADLAVILAASRSRRQMVQRMGRVLRRKPDGGMAALVIVFVRDTAEDPARGAHEGFLDEVTGAADAVQLVPLDVTGAELCACLSLRRTPA